MNTSQLINTLPVNGHFLNHHYRLGEALTKQSYSYSRNQASINAETAHRGTVISGFVIGSNLMNVWQFCDDSKYRNA